jgi:hypothetical protein
MPEFIIAYRGGVVAASKAEGAAHMAKWHAWIKAMCEDAINPGTPLGKSRIVSADGVSEDGGDTPMNGYSIVKAADMKAALEIAKACPVLDINGTLEVAQLMKMG